MACRHPLNQNLILTYETELLGLPLLPKHEPYIEQYLERTLDVIKRALEKHRRVTAIRFDLRIPADFIEPDSDVITRFFDSLKSKIAANQLRRSRKSLRVYSCDVRYVWVREQSTSHNRHYHCCIFLNGDAYRHLGSYREAAQRVISSERMKNMALRIQSAWSSALRLPWERSGGLVHFSKNGVYHVDANSEELIWQIGSLFQRLSYFAKADTKRYGDGYNSFGCSRK